MRRAEGLLHWYPNGWRQRYGAEFVALIEDQNPSGSISLRDAMSIRGAGVAERFREAGVAGEAVPATKRLRSASLLMLCAWSAVVVAGCVFAKRSERFPPAMSIGSSGLAVGAYDAVQVVVMAGALLVVVAMALAVPATLRFLRGEGWVVVKRSVLTAALALGVGVSAVVALSIVANTLTFAQRNGASDAYSAAFVVTGVAVVGAIAAATASGLSIAARLELSRRLLEAEATLACGLAVCILGVTAAAATWWAAIGASAPWFLQAAKPGSAASAFEPILAGTIALMVLGSCAAIYALARIVGSWRAI